MALKPITDALKNINEADSYQKLTGFRLDELIAPSIAQGMTYATYPGGLTTPPCNEVVTWINFKDPLTISPAQLQAFRLVTEESLEYIGQLFVFQGTDGWQRRHDC